jgi:hypothetical protein
VHSSSADAPTPQIDYPKRRTFLHPRHPRIKKKTLTKAPQARKMRSVAVLGPDFDMNKTMRRTNSPPAMLASDITVNPIRWTIVRDSPFLSQAVLKDGA